MQIVFLSYHLGKKNFFRIIWASFRNTARSAMSGGNFKISP